MPLLFALALLQSGPFVSPGAAPPIMQLPLRDEHTRARRRAALPAMAADVSPGRLGECMARAGEDPEAAEANAGEWLKTAKGSATAEPLLCLGAAAAAQDQWAAAERQFLAARDAAAASDRDLRARAGAMAGNAALAADAPARALAALEAAGVDAATLEDRHLAGDIAVDRARALVALGRLPEAEAALVSARTDSPNNPQAWLLSATLARRQGKLALAQAQIQTAADLLPTEPEIGLEAGVIAMLSGNEAAARKSWQSVLAAGPDSPQAATARDYLAQLAPPKDSAR